MRRNHRIHVENSQIAVVAATAAKDTQKEGCERQRERRVAERLQKDAGRESSGEREERIPDRFAGVEEEGEGGDAGGENERVCQRVGGDEVAEETDEDACELLREIGGGRGGTCEEVREEERGQVETAPVALDGLGVRRKRGKNDALSVLGEFCHVEGAENRLHGGF